MCDKPGPATSHRIVPFAHFRLLRAFILNLCLRTCQTPRPLCQPSRHPISIISPSRAGWNRRRGQCGRLPVCASVIHLHKPRTGVGHAIGPHIRAGSVDERSLDRAWAQGNDSQAATTALGPESLPEQEHEGLGRSKGDHERGWLEGEGECRGHIKHGAATIQQRRRKQPREFGERLRYSHKVARSGVPSASHGTR